MSVTNYWLELDSTAVWECLTSGAVYTALSYIYCYIYFIYIYIYDTVYGFLDLSGYCHHHEPAHTSKSMWVNEDSY